MQRILKVLEIDEPLGFPFFSRLAEDFLKARLDNGITSMNLRKCFHHSMIFPLVLSLPVRAVCLKFGLEPLDLEVKTLEVIIDGSPEAAIDILGRVYIALESDTYTTDALGNLLALHEDVGLELVALHISLCGKLLDDVRVSELHFGFEQVNNFHDLAQVGAS